MDCIGSARRPWNRRLIASGLTILLALTTAAAQTPEETVTPALVPPIDQATGTATELRQVLRPGDVVSIVQTTGVVVSGRLLRVDERELVVRTDGPSLTVPYETIQSLDRPRDSSRNGALIGMATGAGVWLPLFVHAVVVDRNEMDEWGAGYLAAGGIMAGIGALVGWAIDTAHSKPPLRFVAHAGTSRSVRLEPLVGRGPGMAVVVSF
jgi:hypothetical protein